MLLKSLRCFANDLINMSRKKRDAPIAARLSEVERDPYRVR
jgi:hypothetical protein